MMMLNTKSIYLLILCAFISGDAQYTWNCSNPNDQGERFIPGVRKLPSNALTNTTAGDVINFYRVQTLNADCAGELTAIEFCYRYSTTAGQGEAVFNWTVLIFEETEVFTVIKVYILESRPSSLTGGECMDIGGGRAECCDRRETIEGFDLQNGFIFGVTESAQGNTAGATLLGFLDDPTFNIQPEYLVFTLQIGNVGQNLSVGSTLPRPEGAQRGLRMLWFVTGSQIAISVNTPIPIPQATTPSLDVNNGALDGDVGGAVGGAVGGLVVITVIVLVVFISVSLLLAKRSQQKSQYKVDSNGSSTLLSSNIDRDSIDGSIKYATISLDTPVNERERLNTVIYDEIKEPTKVLAVPQEYMLPVSTKSHDSKESEIPNAVEERMYANTYEVPMTQSSNLRSASPEIDDDENPYMVPATNEHALYSQMSTIRIDNFTRDTIKLTELLGTGQFGKVYQAEWTAPELKNEVGIAVKTLKKGADEGDKVKFLQEAAIMGQFSHPNVVKLYGVVTEGEPVMLIIELLPKGDLRELLLSMRSQSSCKTDANLPHTLLSFCHQVASGMSYLAAKGFVHRDLAARNILVSEDDVCKIADFGMSRDLEDTNYYISQGGIIPVKWTAPEALHYKKYSTASDVWSFGCVMYEIWSLGLKPFEYSTSLHFVQLINKGVRLAPPPGCPKRIYKIMIGCWHPHASNRPDFVSVVQQLSLPDTKLLKWSEEDKATDPEAATLGAGLDKAVNLYKGLQRRYITK